MINRMLQKIILKLYIWYHEKIPCISCDWYYEKILENEYQCVNKNCYYYKNTFGLSDNGAIILI